MEKGTGVWAAAIPYFPQPAIHLGPFTVRAFGVLAAVAVVAGCWSVVRRGYRTGISLDEMFRFWLWTFGAAVTGALVYMPGGISAFGALSGGLLGAVAWCLIGHLSWPETLRRLDLAAYSIPFAWMFGRLGCALAHDHRGIAAANWLTVRFPEGPRYDLGLLEFLWLAGMAILFRLLDGRPRPAGFYLGLLGVLYGACRVGLDTLRGGQTSLGSGAILIAGLAGWAAMAGLRRTAPR